MLPFDTDITPDGDGRTNTALGPSTSGCVPTLVGGSISRSLKGLLDLLLASRGNLWRRFEIGGAGRILVGSQGRFMGRDDELIANFCPALKNSVGGQFQHALRLQIQAGDREWTK